MKKLLSMLGAVSLAATSSTVVEIIKLPKEKLM
ncbi:lipoprotein [Mesoplasma melaleucae]|uniref:Uncharacterized protein n=1 Tax=Mesoplasma melaleucae TaxID=81459 RepID=A0A2K8NX89_9MOLU|nr:lipoprotein [Mesoplasma melaleucae]ATZ18156.1 hypothetical protein EMELA_v1c06490 [Mesoplasma melaleucae]